MNKELLLSLLNPPVRDLVSADVMDEIDSTNDYLKRKAFLGVPHASAAIAGFQSKGKGRKGRSFYSPQNTGLYLSVLLRPSMAAGDALAVTTLAAVAGAKAIEAVVGTESCEIKWVNDLLLRGRKVTGILTEGCFLGGTASQVPDYLIMGIGFNVWEPEEGFPEEIRDIAGAVMTSSFTAASMQERNSLREQLAAAFLNEFLTMWTEFEQTGIRTYMEGYRERSRMVGKMVRLLDADHCIMENEPAVKVVGIGDEAQLLVEYPDGTVRELSSGEVSVRVDLS